ncbi:TPA_asm: molecular chaperone, partial [Salmonella enterica subsp. enterica serovar Eastbourne]|nr:molecular chaperone [Salmonella enterica subsp. enterica serovar Eastbourne]
ETTVSVLNPEKSGVYLIQSWVDGGQKSDRSPFIVTPPLFRINPGEENILRIVRTGGFLPENRESVFWLNVKSIPAMDSRAPDENRLQLVVKSRLKLFYRPSGLKGDPETAYRKLQLARHGSTLVMRNPTPYFVTLFSLKVNGHEVRDADLVPPEGQVSYRLASPPAGTVTWQAINDYGGISQSESRRFEGDAGE